MTAIRDQFLTLLLPTLRANDDMAAALAVVDDLRGMWVSLEDAGTELVDRWEALFDRVEKVMDKGDLIAVALVLAVMTDGGQLLPEYQ